MPGRVKGGSVRKTVRAIRPSTLAFPIPASGSAPAPFCWGTRRRNSAHLWCRSDHDRKARAARIGAPNPPPLARKVRGHASVTRRHEGRQILAIHGSSEKCRSGVGQRGTSIRLSLKSYFVADCWPESRLLGKHMFEMKAATRSKYRYDSSLDWVAGPDYGKSDADAA